MITLTRPRYPLSLLLIFCAHIVGCSSLSSGGAIRESVLAITPTEPSISFSLSARDVISHLDLSPDRLADPATLETDVGVAELYHPARRSLLISEAWYLRGQNDLEVPLGTSLERFLRAAHYSYEGIFGESGCENATDQLCKDLTHAYNRSVREVARLTNNGAHPPTPDDSRYIVDLLADNDPLTLSEWNVALDNDQGATAPGTLGAAGTGCQELLSDRPEEHRRVRQCVPLVFLITFDDRVTSGRARAHLSALNTTEQNEVQLHGQAITLASNEQGAWNELFAPPSETTPMTCLGNVHPALPTVVFLTPSTQVTYEWPVIGGAVSKDPSIRDHYNFCTMPQSTLDPLPGEPTIDTIHNLLITLRPEIKDAPHIILIGQGASGDGTIKAMKTALKGSQPGSAPLSISGTLSFPAITPGPSAVPIPISSPSELSRSGSLALADTRRLLKRLADPDEGIFGATTRSRASQATDGKLSPVM